MAPGPGVFAQGVLWDVVGWARAWIGLGLVAEARIGPFEGLDVGEAIELGELLAFVGDWLASDPNRPIGCVVI